MLSQRRAFTLVEILIVVLLIGIIAMIVVPRVTSASEEARDTALGTNLIGVRRAIELYRADHSGRMPHINEAGAEHHAGFTWRLTRRTKADGTLDPNGSFGPYLSEWPVNPYVPAAVGATVTCAAGADPPRDNSSGWYFSTTTGIIHVNSDRGALTLD